MLIVLLTVSGLISGLLSFFAAHSGEFMVSPGIIFGICLSIYFQNKIKTYKASRIVLFSLFSGFAYHMAFRTFGYTEKFSEVLSHEGELILSLLLAGLVGATILTLSFTFFMQRLSVVSILAIALCGSILSLTWFIIPEGAIFKTSGWNIHWEPFLSLYLFWQMGMALCFGLVTKYYARV